MPIPTLKTKTARRATEETDSTTQKGTMLPRATRLHAGVGVGSSPHVTSQIPSPYQGHREGKYSRQIVNTPKNGVRMPGNGTGPRPPPRTTSALKSTQSPKSHSVDRGIANSGIRPAHHSKPATRNISIPGRVSNTHAQQQTKPTNACGSNRNSVISNCSSNPPPSSSSSNRNSSSSIGSSFSVGSWNGTGETGDSQDSSTRHVTSGTFPRVKMGARQKGTEENISTAITDRSKLKMPNSYAQKNFNLHLKNKLVGKPLSTSDSSITGQPRVGSCKPNYSSPNLAESNSLKRFNSRIRNMAEKPKFVVPIPVVDSDSSDSEESKTRSFIHAKLVRDMKYRKDNIALVAPFQQPAVQNPVCETNNEECLGTQVHKTSPEDDDGYSSVAVTDQAEEEEQYGKKTTIINDSIETTIKPMGPLKLMDNYSSFKSIGNGAKIPTSACNEMSSSVYLPGGKPSSYPEVVPTKCSEENQFSKSDLESNRNKLPYGAAGGREVTYDSATVPKNTKFASKTECYSNQSSKIDDSIYSVSYEKLVNNKAEMLKRQLDSRTRQVRKLGMSETCHKTPIESSKIFTHPNYAMQNTSMSKGLNLQTISTSGYSPRPNTQKDLEASTDSECDKRLFNRTKSLRFPSQKDAKRELFTKTKSDDEAEFPVPLFTNASFPRGGNKYSTVIPRSVDGQKTRQNRQLTTFAHNCIQKEPIVENQQCDKSDELMESARANEILILKVEIKMLQEKMNCIGEQLSSKSKLLTAYEHSLTNMTHRLQHLSSLLEQKDIQISELKKMVEKACLDGVCISSNFNARKESSYVNRTPSMESLASIKSTGSMISYFSTSSSLFSIYGENKEKKKKNWIRSSFSKAFKRKEKKKYLDYDSSSDAENYSTNSRSFSRSISEPLKGFSSLPASPVPQRNNHVALMEPIEQSDSEVSGFSKLYDEIKLLRHSLREKESALTETRLEALSSAHQIDGLKESLQKLSIEVSVLKCSKTGNYIKEKNPETVDRIIPSVSIRYREVISKKVNVLIPVLFFNGDSCDSKPDQGPQRTINIGQIIVSNTTTWNELFNLLEKTFLRHFNNIDTENCLGVELGSIESYLIGDIVITSSNEMYEFLPYGYFVGDVDWVKIRLLNQSENCVDELSYDTLIPKQNLLKYISILQENRRIILAGVDGNGKRYMARKLAEFVIRRLGVQPSSINIAKFQAAKHTSQELSSYLCHINELCEARRSDLPLVIIVESLNPVENFLDLLSSSLTIPSDQCPYIICTVRVAEPHNYELLSSLINFRWITLVSSQETNQRLLQRICRRARFSTYVAEEEAKLLQILEWIPRCFEAINAVLENSSDELIEPGAFLPLPNCLEAAQKWFSSIWKATVLPKILMAAEMCSEFQNYIDPWKKLYACLREDLPWIVFPASYEANFPIAFKTIEASC